MTNIRELFAENLRKYRHAAGLSQEKLAEKAGTSTYYVGMLEIRRNFPSPEMMERLAAALGIDATEFFLREATPEEVSRAYRKAAIEDIRWVLEKAFEERLRALGGEQA
ncbi:MAG: helix-turn-helix transcriptional regulator [Treponema sp.]|nr:helix-turn-helix transcriptional regulator [Treponema sp.]